MLFSDSRNVETYKHNVIFTTNLCFGSGISWHVLLRTSLPKYFREIDLFLPAMHCHRSGDICDVFISSLSSLASTSSPANFPSTIVVSILSRVAQNTKYKKVKNVKVCSYMAQYPVRRTAQRALHFTP